MVRRVRVMDGLPAPSAASAADQRDDIEQTIERTEAAAREAVHVRDMLLRWSTRLMPYLDRDPKLTVAQASVLPDGKSAHRVNGGMVPRPS